MATTVKGNSVKWGYCFFTYTTSSDNTSYTITASLGVYRNASATAGHGDITFKLGGTEKVIYEGSYPKGTGNYTVVSSKSYKYTRTHSSQTASIDAMATGTDFDLSLASKSFTIPAKPSYTVVYNANSGSGAPANQTKWYGETLKLSAGKPTKSGYIFRGWATSQANANAGTVSYAAGANYTGNAALTLYAVWELAYTLPVINNLTVERCNDDGSDNDEGTYAKVSFDWSVFESNEPRYYGGSGTPFSGNTASIVITVGTLSKTISAPSSASITEVIDTSVADPFIVDNEYQVVITIEDTQTVISNNTRTVTSRLLTPTFLLDANADATAGGILKSAPDDGQGVYLGGDVHADEKNGYFADLFVHCNTNPSGGKKIGEIKTLLTTASYMNGSQDLTFSEPVSEQLTGIVLVWSFWSTKAEDYGWRTFFIPKAMVQLHNGVGYDCPLSRPKSSYFGHKYVYIYDTHIKGHADNVATGTANNVPYANNHWVLRYVFGC